jgi:hypothetical protein
MNPKPEWKQQISRWFSSMKESTGTIDEENAKIVGETGLTWGWFTEKIIDHDETVRYVKIRYSATWVETENKWKYIFYHRDNIFN